MLLRRMVCEIPLCVVIRMRINMLQQSCCGPRFLLGHGQRPLTYLISCKARKEWLAVFWSVWFLGVSRSTGAQWRCVHHVSPNWAPSTCLEMDWVTGLYLVPPSVFHWTFLKEWGVPVRPLFYLRQSPVARTPFCWIRVSTVNLATQSISFWSRAENGRISGSVSKGKNSKALSQKTSLA